MANPLLAMRLQLIFLAMISISLETSSSGKVLGMPMALNSTMLREGYFRFPYDDVAYKFINGRVTWDAARKSCIDQNSNLAVVDSFKKYKFIMDVIKIGNQPGPHVGIHRLFDLREWISVTTGTYPAKIPWAPVRGDDNPANDCMAMWNDDSGIGADECTRPRPYVCEILLR